MRRPEFFVVTGMLAATLIAGCTSAPSTTTSPPTSPPVSTTSTAPTTVSAAATPVQITSTSLGSTDATVTLRDSGLQPLSLSGWTLMVGTIPVQLPSNTTVPAGQSLTLHTASGTSTGTDVYLGQSAQTIAGSLQPGMVVRLQNPSGATVTSFTVPTG